MKIRIYILLFGLLISSCSTELEIDFDDKWILLSTIHQEKNIKVKSSDSFNTTYQINGEEYEAIKFHIKDSTVTIPGINQKLNFSYSPELKEIKFYEKDLKKNDSINENLTKAYTNTFKVSRSEKSGIITLISNNSNIKVLPLKEMIDKSINQYMKTNVLSLTSVTSK